MFAVRPINNQRLWEGFLLASDQANFLHSWYWGEMHRRLNRKVIRLGLYQNSHLAGLIQLIKVTAKRATYFECPGGPVIDWDQSTISWLADYLKAWSRSEQASFIRIRPNILASPASLAWLRRAGLRPAPMHLQAQTTWILPLAKTEAEIMAGMRKTTRYLIRKAEKLGVTVSQTVEPAAIDRLYRLQQETVGRKHFIPFSREYFAAELQAFLPDNIRLFTARWRGRVLAAALIVFYGREAVYHYSGSSNRHREVPASYRLQWEIIRAAKQRGLDRYNFWGYTDNPRHRFYGPSLFKQGFGGNRLDYVPAHDLVTGAGYWPNLVVETWRRRVRHL